MNLTNSQAAHLHSPAFDIVEQHQFQRCKCGCGELVNRTWVKGHHNRAAGGPQPEVLQVRLSPDDYAKLRNDAADRGIGMSTLLKALWKRECGG